MISTAALTTLRRARDQGRGLADAYQLFLAPIIVGCGKQALPNGCRQALDLVKERCFDNGMVYLHFRARD